MKLSSRLKQSMLAAACLAGFSSPAFAHGFAGERFFPATIGTEDPFAADELALPTISRVDGETAVSGEFAKRITSNIAFSIEGEWSHAREDGETIEGFNNIETGLKWQFFTSAEHEAVMSAGLGVEWGGTGAERVGAESTTTITPGFFFGKGFGDLPESAGWARAFAVTGQVGYTIPTEARGAEDELNPYVFSGGIALEYSLPYYNAQIHGIDAPTWVSQLTPIVEIAFQRPVRHGGGEGTTGSVQPGVLWTGQHMQLGAEAIIPLNDESGDKVGWVVQAHFFLDDLFPHSLRRPLFVGRK